MATTSEGREVYEAIFGASEDGYYPVLTTGPYVVEESPSGEHVVSRRCVGLTTEPSDLPGSFERRPLTPELAAELRACFVDGLGTRADEQQELIDYFDARLRGLLR